jgi:large subunit ribosomal protein L2
MQGKLTVRGIGGGNKRVYRIIDFQRSSRKGEIVVGKIERIEYDPNRSAFICLLKHDVDLSADGPSMMKPKIASMSYILCPRSVAVGNEVKASKTEPLDIQVDEEHARPHTTLPAKYYSSTSLPCHPYASMHISSFGLTLGSRLQLHCGVT